MVLQRVYVGRTELATYQSTRLLFRRDRMFYIFFKIYLFIHLLVRVLEVIELSPWAYGYQNFGEYNHHDQEKIYVRITELVKGF